MLDTAQALWLERMRQMDDSVRAWSKEPPRNEAFLMFHLGMLDDLPEGIPDPTEESLSWADFSKRVSNAELSSDEE